MQTGQRAPDFALPDHTGTIHTLRELLANGPVTLFFYPAANTTVCTAEACHFRDLAEEFRAVGASCVGISPDSVATLCSFQIRHRLPYLLLADPERTVAAQFGVKRTLLTSIAPVKRQTFVVDRDRTVLSVISSELRANTHADTALRILRNRVEP